MGSATFTSVSRSSRFKVCLVRPFFQKLNMFSSHQETFYSHFFHKSLRELLNFLKNQNLVETSQMLSKNIRHFLIGQLDNQLDTSFNFEKFQISQLILQLIFLFGSLQSMDITYLTELTKDYGCFILSIGI
jgi:hypothetical protein